MPNSRHFWRTGKLKGLTLHCKGIWLLHLNIFEHIMKNVKNFSTPKWWMLQTFVLIHLDDSGFCALDGCRSYLNALHSIFHVGVGFLLKKREVVHAKNRLSFKAILFLGVFETLDSVGHLEKSSGFFLGYKLTLLDSEVDALCSRGGYGATAATVKHLSVGGRVFVSRDAQCFMVFPESRRMGC